MNRFEYYNNCPDFNALAKSIHAHNVAAGWWDIENSLDLIFTKLMLVVSEISEAMEGERKNLMDNHLPDRRAGEVELADALIRVLDLGGRFAWEYDANVKSHSYIKRSNEVAAKQFFIVADIVSLGRVSLGSAILGIPGIDRAYSGLINSIIDVADDQNYDIIAALFEKWEYNKHRADHKRENRAKENGKKF